VGTNASTLYGGSNSNARRQACWEVKIMNWDNLLVIGRDRDSFKALVARKIRERRRDERQLAEHRTTKHQLQARNSCVADARSYRVARRLPVPAAAPFDWKALISVKRFSKIRSVAQEISRLAIRALADQAILRALFKSRANR
jgi:hypothetical protein